MDITARTQTQKLTTVLENAVPITTKEARTLAKLAMPKLAMPKLALAKLAMAISTQQILATNSNHMHTAVADYYKISRPHKDKDNNSFHRAHNKAYKDSNKLAMVPSSTTSTIIISMNKRKRMRTRWMMRSL